MIGLCSPNFLHYNRVGDACRAASLQLTKVSHHLADFLTILSGTENSTALILFAVDEAKAMAVVEEKNSFYYFRAILREAIDSEAKTEELLMFQVYLDTFGKIQIFLPEAPPSDPSLKPFSNKCRKYFPALSLLQFRREQVGEWWSFSSEKECDSLIKDIPFHQGRYLWRKPSEPAESDARKKLVQFARIKLLGGVQEEHALPENHLTIAMALLGCRVALSFHCSEKLSFEMVRSHMGVCYYTSDDNSMLLYGYPSEPILSLAAADSLIRKSFNWEWSLRTILPAVRKGLVGAGVRGELICRILLCLAWDSCQKSSSLHYPISVQSYLKALGGDRLLEEFKVDAFKDNQDRILNGRLYFTHFVYVNYEVKTEKKLGKLLSCGQAVLCRNNQQAIDLLIPIVLSDNKTISFIAIQCKNRKKISWKGATKKYTASCMEFSKYTNPYLVLCMQVGTGSANRIQNLTSDPKSHTGVQNVVAINGLSEEMYPILRTIPGLIYLLESLRVSWEDPLSYYENDKSLGAKDNEKLLRKVMGPTYLDKEDVVDDEEILMDTDTEE